MIKARLRNHVQKMYITAIHVAIILGFKYIAPNGGYALAKQITTTINIKNSFVK